MTATHAPREFTLPGFWRRGLHTVFICVLIALLLYVFAGGNWWLNLLYSLCIGLNCWLFIDGSRQIIARLARTRHSGDSVRLRHGWLGWARMSFVIVAGATYGYVAGSLLADLLTGRHSPMPLVSSWRGYSLSGFIALTACVAGTYYFSSRQQIAEARTEAESARRMAAEHQLKLLEAQLEPHMLFNTLANLRALIALDPPRAQEMLDHLIGFLRATLQGSRVGMHPLRDEFARLADYLALMRIRMGERLQVELQLPEALAQQPVPALLLQPLVENAIKHGLEPHRGGGRIVVSATSEGQELLLCVMDNGAGLSAGAAQPSRGFGMTQVSERLATLYGERASLALLTASAQSGTLARIRLPLAAGSKVANEISKTCA
ncbi:MAG TPA: histidine kinase [Methylibium sp.]